MNARIYARSLSKHLPGKPRIIVRNLPGGGGTIAPNYVYKVKPDGLTLLITSVAVPLAQLLGQRGVDYDLTKMTLLVGTESYNVFYTKSGIVNRPEDLPKAKGLSYGGSSGTSTIIVLFMIAKQLLDIPARFTSGYEGGGDARRAFLSGEINMTADSIFAYEAIEPYVRTGEVMLLFQTGMIDEKGNVARGPGFAQTPTTGELYENIYGKPPAGMTWDAYRVTLTAHSQGYTGLFLPPTPDSMVRVFWDATEAMIKDADFVSLVSAINAESRWWAGEAYDKQFKLGLTMKPEIRDWIRDLLAQYGIAVG